MRDFDLSTEMGPVGALKKIVREAMAIGFGMTALRCALGKRKYGRS